MKLQPSTESLLSEIEQFAQRKFRYRLEIGLLVEAANSVSLRRVLDDIQFNAKFLTNAFNLLKRVGSDSPETVKLSSEFRDGVEKVSTLMRTLMKESPNEIRDLFLKRFLSLSTDNMTELLSLCNELSWVKNYSLEQNRHHQ